MRNNNAMMDDKRAVERWENEGGKVTSVDGANASLRRTPFRAKDNSIEKPFGGAQKAFEQSGFFSGFVRV